MRIGFIGVGLMGGPLARNLIRNGYSVDVFDLSAEAIEKTVSVGESGKKANSIDELKSSDVIFTSLPLPQHVTDVMLNDGGLYEKLNANSTHVELSTIDASTAETLEKEANKKNISYIQCTLGKTPAHAEKAEEPMFIGGDERAYEKIKNILSSIGIVNYVGPVAASCAVKLISNMIGMTNVAVLAEGMKVGDKAGLDRKKLLELLADTGAHSFQMDVRGPWIAEEDYKSRFPLDLALKDIRIGLEMSKDWNLDLQTMESALKEFMRAHDEGYGQEDCNAVFKVL
ncbi:NAD(P)-dependent oxidoreductase [Desulfohalobium retbaense]|uniref:6-phosphogluconate dehydrogenase NAD-binding protein n=1 Tax=Desulfohalobium retbaense (strain ATCC 49708 / DSM 5692 / JCM 16813 / HR100) TaxID=485915 RepID=C8X5B0_DESRD|nr:NAD(P)-dependent oxidoreductase [Desulfohalobium retbaense]ACV69607.1 6-phosphogluconate dehydrogenase NAD-binding protein [Desulfohalobium retbaense DSM 5692]